MKRYDAGIQDMRNKYILKVILRSKEGRINYKLAFLAFNKQQPPTGSVPKPCIYTIRSMVNQFQSGHKTLRSRRLLTKPFNFVNCECALHHFIITL